VCADLRTIAVESFSGATVAYARSIGAGLLVRGLRSSADLDFERGMAAINRDAGGIETIVLFADGAHSHLSSSLVRQAIEAGLPVDGLVPPAVARFLGNARTPPASSR
jgi:pantetheine-phosphate adenylyltransferase